MEAGVGYPAEDRHRVTTYDVAATEINLGAEVMRPRPRPRSGIRVCMER